MRRKGDRRRTTPPGQTPAPPPRRLRGPYLWLAKILTAVLAPLCVLLLLEAGLRLGGYGYATGFLLAHETQAGAYRSNPRFDWPFLGAAFSRPVTPFVLERDKPPDTYRIFVVGESAARGIPDPEFSFARILEAMLRDRYPGTHFEIINTARTAINSHACRAIVRDCQDLGADLFIVYMGNNEVVGPYGPGTVFQGYTPSLGMIRASLWLRQTRVGQWLGDTIRAATSRRGDAQADWGGMPMFLRRQVREDDPRLQRMYEHFRANLGDICRAAHAGGSRVLLATVVSNLKDCPPLASEHRDGLSAEDLARWEKLYQEGRTLQAEGQTAQALERYREALKIDDRHADLHYRLGRTHLSLEKLDLAREHLERARDLDTLRFRPDSRINEIIRQVGREMKAQGVELLDTETILASDPRTPQGIPGRELLYEHVHLTFLGNYLLAAAMFESIDRLLPTSVRGEATSPPQPPPLERCKALTLYTPFAEAAALRHMEMMLADPPFSPEHAEGFADQRRRTEAQCTPALLLDLAARYEQALRARPDDVLLRTGYRGVQLARGDIAAVLEQSRQIIRQHPQASEARAALGLLLVQLNQPAQAIEELQAALALQPWDYQSLLCLGDAYAAQKDYAQAVNSYRQAIKLRPNENHALAHLSWLYATCPDASLRDGPEAVRLARKAVETAKEATDLVAARIGLAAAHAETGDFNQAVHVADQARAEALAAGRDDLAGILDQHLQSYRAEKPFHQNP